MERLVMEHVRRPVRQGLFNDPERDLHDLMVDVCEETLALAGTSAR